MPNGIDLILADHQRVNDLFMNHPGSDGGSGYWFPTPVGVGCGAA
jgi:hypothetical protein